MLYFGRDKSSNAETMREMGDPFKDDRARDFFMYAGYELAIEYEINTDTGEAKAVRIV